jgi:hypothetical protein
MHGGIGIGRAQVAILSRTLAPQRSQLLPAIEHAPMNIDAFYLVSCQPLLWSKGRYLTTRRSGEAIVPCDCRRMWSSRIVRHPWRHWPGLTNFEDKVVPIHASTTKTASVA